MSYSTELLQQTLNVYSNRLSRWYWPWSALNHECITLDAPGLVYGQPLCQVQKTLDAYDNRFFLARWWQRLTTNIEKQRALLVYCHVSIALVELKQGGKLIITDKTIQQANKLSWWSYLSGLGAVLSKYTQTEHSTEIIPFSAPSNAFARAVLNTLPPAFDEDTPEDRAIQAVFPDWINDRRELHAAYIATFQRVLDWLHANQSKECVDSLNVVLHDIEKSTFVKKYKALTRKYHPDKQSPNKRVFGERAFKRLGTVIEYYKTQWSKYASNIRSQVRAAEYMRRTIEELENSLKENERLLASIKDSLILNDTLIKQQQNDLTRHWQTIIDSLQEEQKTNASLLTFLETAEQNNKPISDMNSLLVFPTYQAAYTFLQSRAGRFQQALSALQQLHLDTDINFPFTISHPDNNQPIILYNYLEVADFLLNYIETFNKSMQAYDAPYVVIESPPNKNKFTSPLLEHHFLNEKQGETGSNETAPQPATNNSAN